LFLNNQTPKTIKETPNVTTSRVGEIKQKQSKAPPKHTTTTGAFLFLAQIVPRLLITPPPLIIFRIHT
jgi:hypothetical protein